MLQGEVVENWFEHGNLNEIRKAYIRVQGNQKLLRKNTCEEKATGRIVPELFLDVFLSLGYNKWWWLRGLSD